MTKKITQEEIYNLTDKQVREEYLKHTISAIENTLGILSTKQTIEDLKAENQRLKAQLDKEIHINRKMKSCLSAFARRDNWKAIEGCADWLFLLDPLMAEETLKEIENKE